MRLKKLILLLFFVCAKLAFAQPTNPDLKKVELWYDDDFQVRKLKTVYYVLESDNRVMHGKMISYYESGKIMSEGDYVMNQPTGEWKYYFEDGKIKMIAYLENANSGYWKYYYENGNLKQEGRIVNNKQEGFWKLYFENGELKSTGSYKEGIKDGEWNYFFEEGNIKAESNYQKGKGFYREYFMNGNVKMEGETMNNQSEGEWRYYYPSGQLQAKGYELHGVKNGHWEYYYETGKLSSEGNYVDGKQHDAWKYYYENGEVSSQGNHYEGNKDGQWKLYHKDGAFKGEGIFKRGDGKYKEYYQSGVLKIEGDVLQNKNSGIWKYYYEDGSLEGECLFVNGKGEYIGYYKDGTLKMKGQIEDNLKTGTWELYNPEGKLAGYYKTIHNEKGEEVFKEADSADYQQYIEDVKSDTIVKNEVQTNLPNFKFKPKKKSKLKWFNPKLNELSGVILSANPLGFVGSYFPVTIEYYFQERLGYEFEYSIIRNPFFLRDDKVPYNTVYYRGQALEVAQRLYEPAKSYGMIYFGHRIRYKNLKFAATVVDTVDYVDRIEKISARENTLEYLLMFGNRVFKHNYKEPGFTFDVFITAGIGYRWYLEKYVDTPIRTKVFNEVDTKEFFIPYRLEFSFGYLF